MGNPAVERYNVQDRANVSSGLGSRAKKTGGAPVQTVVKPGGDKSAAVPNPDRFQNADSYTAYFAQNKFRKCSQAPKGVLCFTKVTPATPKDYDCPEASMSGVSRCVLVEAQPEVRQTAMKIMGGAFWMTTCVNRVCSDSSVDPTLPKAVAKTAAKADVAGLHGTYVKVTPF